VKIVFYLVVLLIYFTSKLVGSTRKYGIMISIVMNDQINTKSLQQQEEKQVKIAANEKENITHV
jgi:hypothetical protein